MFINEDAHKDSSLSRRNFVALGAGVAGTCALAGAAAKAAMAAETKQSETADTSSSEDAKDASAASERPDGDTLEADIVIAGAGASGMFAAIEACRAGKSVIVVEKGASIGMANGALAGGPFVVQSTAQKEAGIDITVDIAFNHIMDWSHWSISAPVVRHCLELSGETVDMFTTEFGIPTYMRPDNYGSGYDSVRIGFGTKEQGIRGEERWLPLEQWCEGRGAQFIFDCALESLIVEDGAVAGMHCVYGDGTKVDVRGKKTLVATGGFLGNEEMMIERYGTKVNPLGNTLSDGTGINAVVDAGGMYGTQWGLCGNEFTGSSDKVSPVWDRKSPAFACGVYGGLMVNHFGRRFANEAKFANFPLALGGAISLVGGTYYCIVDQAYVDGLEGSDAWTLNGSDEEGWPTGKMTLAGKTLEGVQESFDTAVEQGWCYKADTIEGLADAISCPALVDTVATYNADCESGVDTFMNKPASFMNAISTAPFYALEFQPSGWTSMGGVKTNDRLQSIDRTGAAVPNLYVAGADNGSTISTPYCDYEGTSLMTAYNSGRLAGIWMSEDIDADEA
jgi:fumarate reductase flavoprotein subunit